MIKFVIAQILKVIVSLRGAIATKQSLKDCFAKNARNDTSVGILPNAKLLLKFMFACFFMAYSIIAARAGEELILGQKQAAVDNALYGGNFAYIIGPGDTLEINVWRHPDLTTQVTVRPDGKISFPLIDEISVSNISPGALKNDIAKRLSTIIQEPQVTVNVLSFQSKKFFVLGEVNNPGLYPFAGGEGVLDGIAKAGGYKQDTAALKSVILIRRGYGSKPETLRLNIYNLITKGDITQDVKLDTADVIFVPKSFIANVNTFVDQFFTKTDPVLRYYLDIYDVKNPGRRYNQ